MGKAADLQREMEDSIREFFANVKDEDIVTVGAGTYFGNTFISFSGGAIRWKSGPNSTSPQACQQTNIFIASSGTGTRMGSCPREVPKYKITVP